MPVETPERTSVIPASLPKEELKDMDLVKESNFTNKCQKCNAGCRGDGGKRCSIMPVSVKESKSE